MKGNHRNWILALLILAAPGALQAGAELISGAPSSFTIGPVASSTLFIGGTGYQVSVPPGATRLEIRLATNTNEADLDLFARYNEDISGSGGIVLTDYTVNSNFSTSVILVIKPNSSSPLRAGIYYLGMRLNTAGVAVTGAITAIVDTSPQELAAGRQLVSGAPARFSLGAVEFPALFNGEYSFGIRAPASATLLEIRLLTDTPANVDLYVRRDMDVTRTGNTINATYRQETASGNETITVTPASSPPLAGGIYFIALRLVTGFTPVTGTVTVTLAAPPAGPVTTLSSGVPHNFSFPPVNSPELRSGYRITVPSGSNRLEVRLDTTAPPGANLDLYLRFGSNIDDHTAPDVEKRETPGGSEIITRVDSPFNPLRAGDYYIAVRLLTLGSTVTGLLTATHLSGVAPTGPTAEVTPASLDFGSLTVGQTSDRSLTVRNIGGAILSISSFNATNPQFALTSPALPATVAPQGQQSLSFRFTPASAGAHAGTVTLTTNDSNRPTVNIPVQGTAAAPGTAPVLSVAPTVDFGNLGVGQSADRTLAVRNSGTATLSVNSLTAGAPFSVVSPSGTFTVAPSGEQTVTLRFAPAAAGAQSGSLTIASNDPTRPSVAVTLIGTGQTGPTPTVSVSATSLSFSATTGANPPSQTFSASASGGSVSVSVSSTQPWLSASPSRATLSSSPASFTAAVNAAGLVAGAHTAEIRLTQSAAAAAPDPSQAALATITVRLTLTGGGPCPAGPSATPAITRGAIVNAASFASSTLPGGAIARGSIFTLFGNAVGPTALVQAARFPLETTLGCVSVRVTQGSTSVDAIPLAAIATQVNAIMPSNAPLGDAQITVTWNGRASAAVPVRIVASSFGIFTANQSGAGPGIFQNFVTQTEQPINSPRRPATPRQVVTAWGTGLGAINAPDNAAPPAGDLPVSVEIEVGGKRVTNKLYSGRGPCCAGLDQVVFEIPADAPLGCFVPVVVRAGGVTGNGITLAISRDGSECSDPNNPVGNVVRRGGRVGTVQLLRVDGRLQLDATQNFTNLNVDLGVAAFAQTPGGEFDYNPLTSLPPAGSCAVVSAGNIDVSGILGGSLPAVPGGARVLDAGAAISVTGPRGTQALPRSTDVEGAYFNLIGGSLPVPGLPSLPLFLEPGSYMIRGPGGPDVGAFTANLTIPAPVTWTNREQSVNLTRSQGVTVNWSGGDPARQGIIIIGANLDQESGAGAAFVCPSDLVPRTFTVPAAILNALPPSNAARPDQTVGFLLLVVGPSGDFSSFTATGIDIGVASYGQFFVTTAYYR